MVKIVQISRTVNDTFRQDFVGQFYSEVLYHITSKIELQTFDFTLSWAIFSPDLFLFPTWCLQGYEGHWLLWACDQGRSG